MECRKLNAELKTLSEYDVIMLKKSKSWGKGYMTQVATLCAYLYKYSNKPLFIMNESGWEELRLNLIKLVSNGTIKSAPYTAKTLSTTVSNLRKILTEANQDIIDYSFINKLFVNTGINNLAPQRDTLNYDDINSILDCKRALLRERLMCALLYEGIPAAMSKFDTINSKYKQEYYLRDMPNDVFRDDKVYCSNENFNFTFSIRDKTKEIFKEYLEELASLPSNKVNSAYGKMYECKDNTKLFRVSVSGRDGSTQRDGILSRLAKSKKIIEIFDIDFSPLKDLQVAGIAELCAIMSVHMDLELSISKKPLQYALTRYSLSFGQTTTTEYIEIFEQYYSDYTFEQLKQLYGTTEYKKIYENTLAFYDYVDSLGLLNESSSKSNGSSDEGTLSWMLNPQFRTKKDDTDITDDVESKRLLGAIGETKTILKLKDLGYVANQVKHYYGYDILAVKGNERLLIEVKTSIDLTFFLTKTEFNRIKDKRLNEYYRLAIVYNDVLYIFKNVYETLNLDRLHDIFEEHVIENSEICYKFEDVRIRIPENLLTKAESYSLLDYVNVAS